MERPPQDETFDGCLAGNLRAASKLATRRYDAALREHGLRITQVAILAQVQQHEPLSLSQLALTVSSERSVVARDVSVLEREALVQVVVDPTDRRARNVTLTDAGRARLQAVAPAWRSAQRDMREALGDELGDALLNLSRAVVAALESTGATHEGFQ